MAKLITATNAANATRKKESQHLPLGSGLAIRRKINVNDAVLNLNCSSNHQCFMLTAITKMLIGLI